MKCLNYSNKDDLEAKIVMLYSTQSMGEKMTNAEKTSYESIIDRSDYADVIFLPREPRRKPKTDISANNDEKTKSTTEGKVFLDRGLWHRSK